MKEVYMSLQTDLKLLTVMFRSFEAVKEVIIEDVKHYDLNITEFGTLEYLLHKGPSPINLIGDKVLMAKSSMSYVIDQLSKKGYIEWLKDEEDMRRKIVGLTDLGKITIEDAFQRHLQIIGRLFDMLSDEEKQNIIRDLKKVGFYAKDLKK
jgi:MarR family transcriptional regulator, 2-MHQ and catechol-resistance regulon repressor